MTIIATTQTKFLEDFGRMFDDGKLDLDDIKNLHHQAEITIEATNDLYSVLEFAMPHTRDADMGKYKEFEHLAMEMLEYNVAAVDAMICLKKCAEKILKNREQLKLAV